MMRTIKEYHITDLYLKYHVDFLVNFLTVYLYFTQFTQYAYFTDADVEL
jgi:hypothetical protein